MRIHTEYYKAGGCLKRQPPVFFWGGLKKFKIYPMVIERATYRDWGLFSSAAGSFTRTVLVCVPTKTKYIVGGNDSRSLD